MEIIYESKLQFFARKHSDARKPLLKWIDITKTTSWGSFAEVRHTFRSADYVKNKVIFDIGGNNFRVVTSINYNAQHVYILEAMTHAEYIRWKV